jgi:hypothetical protein
MYTFLRSEGVPKVAYGTFLLVFLDTLPIMGALLSPASPVGNRITSPERSISTVFIARVQSPRPMILLVYFSFLGTLTATACKTHRPGSCRCPNDRRRALAER